MLSEVHRDHLREQGYHKGHIGYTGIDHWYAKLGYKTYARFRFA